MNIHYELLFSSKLFSLYNLNNTIIQLWNNYSTK